MLRIVNAGDAVTPLREMPIRSLILAAAAALAVGGCGAAGLSPGSEKLVGYDEDGDGIDDAVDRCLLEAEDYDGFEDEDGCTDADNDGDLVADRDDRCPLLAEDRDGFEDADGCPEPGSAPSVATAPPEEQAATGQARAAERAVADEPEAKKKHKPKKGKRARKQPERKKPEVAATEDKPPGPELEVLDRVYFAPDSAALPDVPEALDAFARLALDKEGVTLVVVGRADSAESSPEELSRKRAAAIETYLLAAGVPSSQVRTVAIGDRQPRPSAEVGPDGTENRSAELAVEEAPGG